MVRLMLFLSAYAPLFVITAIRFEDPWLRGGSAALALIGILALWLVASRRATLEPQPRRVASLSDEGGAVAGYTATYLLPFVTVGDPQGSDVVAYLALFALLALLHVRTSLVQVNPTLYLVGRRVWRYTDASGGGGYAMVRAADAVQVGSVLHGVHWGGEVWWIKKVTDDEAL